MPPSPCSIVSVNAQSIPLFQFGVFYEGDLEIHNVRRSIFDTDVVLVEGFKRSDAWPQVGLSREQRLSEEEAAAFIKASMTKPVAVFIAGQTAPKR